MAIAYAEEIGALYLETSAKDDTNVQDIFVKLSKSTTLSQSYVNHRVINTNIFVLMKYGRLSVASASNGRCQCDPRHKQHKPQQRQCTEQQCSRIGRLLLG